MMESVLIAYLILGIIVIILTHSLDEELLYSLQSISPLESIIPLLILVPIWPVHLFIRYECIPRKWIIRNWRRK